MQRFLRFADDAWNGRFAATDPRVVRTVIAAAVLVVFKVIAQIAVGPAWDSYSFLANAAQFAGEGYGYTEPARPPLISLITSVPMRFGMTDAAVIQVVDGLLTVVALAALYLVLRRRFDRSVSTLGVLAFLIAPPVWRWIGVGYTDLSAVGITLVALFVAIKATEDDPRWYLGLPVAMLAATLMRTTSLLFVGVVGVWFLLRSRPFRHARHIAGGVALAIAAYAPLGWYYERTAGSALYPLVASMRVQEAATTSHLSGLERPVDSFVRSMPQLAAPSALQLFVLVLLAAAAAGVLVAAITVVVRRKVAFGRVFGALLVVAVGAKLAAGRGPVAALIVAACTFALWRLLASDEHPAEGGPTRTVSAAWALDATMFSWLVGLLVFHEQWAQRVERYYIAMAPALIYVVALGLIAFVASARKLRRFNGITTRGVAIVGALIPAVLTVVVLGGAAIDMLDTQWTRDRGVEDSARTATWLRDHGMAQNATVYSDMWPQTSWYLKGPVKAMPGFDDRRAVSHELDKNNAQYYVTFRGAGDLADFAVGTDTGGAKVLVAKNTTEPRPQRVQYLGAGWENYAEELTGFDFYLDHDEGDYNLQGSAFLDAYPIERLSSYRAVAVYGALWHSRSESERLMMEYVDAGGTLLIDASANLQQPYSLQDCVLFDTVLSRTVTPAGAQIQLDPAFERRHPELEGMHNAPFATAEDPVWVGASYDALPGTEPLEVLASANGRPIVAERHWGRGRVILVGANLLWHAHATGDADEAKLVRAIFDEALRPRSASAMGGRKPVRSAGL